MKLEHLTPAVGLVLLDYSRRVLEEQIKNGAELEPLLSPDLVLEKAGIFCTLRINDQLRGCIGYPYPSHRLGEALVKSTIQAAVDDPRFKIVQIHELENIQIELTILTPPDLIQVSDSNDYYKEIVIGQDGLIIEKGNSRGLLLPQVAVEQNWTIEEFLQGMCRKAYLPLDAWKDIKKVKIYRFSGVIFQESN